jgi:hypothetical protein
MFIWVLHCKCEPAQELLELAPVATADNLAQVAKEAPLFLPAPPRRNGKAAPQIVFVRPRCAARIKHNLPTVAAWVVEPEFRCRLQRHAPMCVRDLDSDVGEVQLELLLRHIRQRAIGPDPKYCNLVVCFTDDIAFIQQWECIVSGVGTALEHYGTASEAELRIAGRRRSFPGSEIGAKVLS